MTERRELSFDGFGINGPDEFRTRIVTFRNDEDAQKYGPLFESAPNLLSACEYALDRLNRLKVGEMELQLKETLTKAIQLAERK